MMPGTRYTLTAAALPEPTARSQGPVNPANCRGRGPVCLTVRGSGGSYARGSVGPGIAARTHRYPPGRERWPQGNQTPPGGIQSPPLGPGGLSLNESRRELEGRCVERNKPAPDSVSFC